MAKVRVKVLAGFCITPGVDASPGDELALEEVDAMRKVQQQRVEILPALEDLEPEAAEADAGDIEPPDATDTEATETDAQEGEHPEAGDPEAVVNRDPKPRARRGRPPKADK